MPDTCPENRGAEKGGVNLVHNQNMLVDFLPGEREASQNGNDFWIALSVHCTCCDDPAIMDFKRHRLRIRARQRYITATNGRPGVHLD